MSDITIITYNVNGIRSAIQKSFAQWLQEENPDIICLQETKASPDQVDMAFAQEQGYHAHWHTAEKKGYSGVVTLSRREPDFVSAGCGHTQYDSEGRVLRTDFGEWTLLNCYFPSGTTGEERQQVKYEFLDYFFNWMEELKKERSKIIVVGDYNIAHTERDIHNAKSNQKSSGFLPEERAWMSKWFSSGFTDAFRWVHPDRVEYSWWSFRANARANNKGWRIDYQSVTDNISDRVLDVRHLMDVTHSDHCPVWMKIGLEW